MRKVVLCTLLESGFETLCLIVFAFAPSYEGTGRSLSLKLIQQLRQQSAQSQVSTTAENKTTTTARLASGTSSLNGPRSPQQLFRLLLVPYPCAVMGVADLLQSGRKVQSPRGEVAFLKEQQASDQRGA